MNRCIVFCAYALEREGGNSGVCSIENKNYSFNLSAHFKEETSDNRAYSFIYYCIHRYLLLYSFFHSPQQKNNKIVSKRVEQRKKTKYLGTGDTEYKLYSVFIS